MAAPSVFEDYTPDLQDFFFGDDTPGEHKISVFLLLILLAQLPQTQEVSNSTSTRSNSSSRGRDNSSSRGRDSRSFGKLCIVSFPD